MNSKKLPVEASVEASIEAPAESPTASPSDVSAESSAETTIEPTAIDDSSTGESATDKKASNLLKFDDANTVNTGKDINSKITALDTDLAQMRAELGTINSSVEEGLDRLSDTDTNLTAKVSETYKRLGEIDNAYKSLIDISSRIDTDIQRLNGDVSSVASQSATGLKSLEQSTIAQSNEFTQKNQLVASKVSQLVETSKLTSELLEQKIQSTTETLLKVETHVISEIESLTASTNDKTSSLENSVDRNRAKILKLQSIDEAIIKRATTLEISSAELTVKSQDIQASVGQLELSSDNLSTGLNELREQTKALEEITGRHGTLIGGLQKASADLSDKLLLLTGRESKHFNIFTGSFVLLLIVTAVIYFVQQGQFEAVEINSASQSEMMGNKMASLQQQQTDAAAVAEDSLAALENKVDELNVAMQEEVSKEMALVEFKMQDIQDKVQSVEGRFNNDAPFSQIGDDNIIHGAQWISALPAGNYTVQLAYVSDTASLYALAQRYNHYLKDSLSYFVVTDNGVSKYVLLSGNYVTQQQAMVMIDSMPRYIDMQQPVIRQVSSVQQYIAEK